MATFEFTSEGIEAGFGKDGFFSGGETTKFGFDEREYPGHALPRIRQDKLSWSINVAGQDAWDRYAEVISVYSFDEANSPMTSRADEIKRVLGSPLTGVFVRWKPGEITLSISLQPDAAFATLIMGAIAAGREIDFFCQGFLFAAEDRPGAAAPTASGWADRKEPLFLNDHPIIRIV